MRAKYAREIRGGLYFGGNIAKQMYEYPTLNDFLMECLDGWSERASDVANRAAARAIRKERIRRGGRP